MNNNELKARIKNFMSELGVPLTSFCKNVNLSTSAIRKWRSDQVQLAESTMQRIDQYLQKYGF